MALETGRKRRGRLSMTSLIDVIFLLLLFFMLSSTFSKFSEIELSGAGAGSGLGDKPVVFLRLGAERLLLNGKLIETDALPDALHALTGGDARTVLVSLTDEVTSQQLVDILALLRGIRGIQASVLA